MAPLQCLLLYNRLLPKNNIYCNFSKLFSKNLTNQRNYLPPLPLTFPRAGSLFPLAINCVLIVSYQESNLLLDSFLGCFWNVLCFYSTHKLFCLQELIYKVLNQKIEYILEFLLWLCPNICLAVLNKIFIFFLSTNRKYFKALPLM